MNGSANNLTEREGGGLCSALGFGAALKSLEVGVCHCPKYGTSIGRQMSNGLNTMLSVPALDDDGGFVLSAEIFVDKKPEFYEFSDDTKKFTEADILARFSEKRS